MQTYPTHQSSPDHLPRWTAGVAAPHFCTLQDRAFLRDVHRLRHVDVGDGWLIFGLPPAEVAVHPADKDNVYGFYLMFDDITAFVTEMQKHYIACGPVQDEGWGLLSHVT